MPLQGNYLLSANMDVAPEKEDLFNEVYDEEHVPAVLKVPGVLAAARFKTEELTMMLGGERKTIVVEGEPKFSALYELESPDVMLSKEWAMATELGRWPGEVRPYTANRRITLRRRID